MEIEDFIIANIAIAILASSFIYAATNPLPSGIPILETLAIGGLCAYLFNNPNIL
ncbi:hypothetical protein V7O61_14920 [Methanolobus sp. WCC1]|jgi:hypothetical protein|uniref:Uncharacterized protein n=1 Tax=Methanolobus tindarius DSM 2278 TaxID=1090322 RepID=W9DWQ0_METTI|nr:MULTISPECIES: hypothetical protein [Methanolobus]ETA68092.1 hypothetical protein MettiDRAFT_1542 [Methanolobus tindarius DSM 2278]